MRKQIVVVCRIVNGSPSSQSALEERSVKMGKKENFEGGFNEKESKQDERMAEFRFDGVMNGNIISCYNSNHYF